MTKTVHTVYIWTMVVITVAVTIYLAAIGLDYYNTPLTERYFHPHNDWFKPSGAMGHGLGILGTFMIVFGVAIYIARKRYNFLSKYIRLKYLLEFHIFLCTLGPILVLYHTTFKFGGVVSIAFWSMVMVVLSGAIGRFIYIQIPRTIEGRELGLNEVKEMKENIANSLASKFEGAEASALQEVMQSAEGTETKTGLVGSYFADMKNRNKLSKVLKMSKMDKDEQHAILNAFREERSLARKIVRLETMQRWFKYWHVIHLPFALIMLIIVIIHVGITLALGYKWIF